MFPSLYGVVSQGGAADWWAVAGKTCVAAYQPIGAASLAASYVNLANPGTYNAAPGTAPTWASATGWTFNGTTQYLTTGIVPSASWSMFIRFSSATVGGIGAYIDPTNCFYLRPNRLGARTYANGAGYSVSGAQTSGVMAMAGKNAYLNGATDGTIPAGGSNTAAIGIGVLDLTSFPVRFFYTGSIQAFAVYSDTLSGAEVAGVSAAMAAL